MLFKFGGTNADNANKSIHYPAVERLKAIRRTIATQESLPAYLVFTNEELAVGINLGKICEGDYAGHAQCPIALALPGIVQKERTRYMSRPHP